LLEQNPDKTNNESRPSPDKHAPGQQGDVIYVLRTTQQHHVMLGMIADRKANIVLGAFLIFITVTQKMADNNGLELPLWILTGFFTLSALFALLVIAPRFRNKPKKPGAGNLLFFGTFASMGQEEYIEQLSKQLQDNEQARQLMMKDIYQIGLVLDKKYKNLRYSYASLALGIMGSVFAFALQNFPYPL